MDASGFPIVRVRAQDNVSSEDLEPHFQEYREILARNERYVAIFDASDVKKVDAVARKQYAEFVEKNSEDFARLCIGCGFVISSSLIRGALTAIMWLTGTLPFPYKIFGTNDEAEAWAKEKFEENS